MQVAGNLRRLTQVRSLVLKRNNLTVLPLDLINALALDELVIVEEGFVFTGQVAAHTRLKSLFFSGNTERHLNRELYELDQLADLTVFGSALKHISPRIARLSALNKLTILACPLAGNRKDVAKLRQLVQGKCEIIAEDNYQMSYQ